MRNKITKLPLLFLALFTVISTIPPSIATAEPKTEEIQTGELQLEVDGGFDGIARLGAYSPVRIKVSMISRDIKGEIQVEASLDPGRKILFAKPVELSPGGEMVFYFEVPVVSAKKDLTVRIVENKNKKLLAEKKFSFKRLLPPDTIFIGVLTEEPDSFKWLNGYTVPYLAGNYSDEKMKLMLASGQIVPSQSSVAIKDGVYEKREAVVVSLNRDSFPYNTEVMDSFNYLIVSRFDTGLLNEEQVSAMENWVDSGGALLLGAGLSWQKVYNGLPDSLKPYSIKGIEDYNAMNALKNFTGKDSSAVTLKTAIGALDFEYVPQSGNNTGYPTRYLDNDIIAGNEKNPLVIKYGKGNGNITVFTFDPTLEPFVSWQYKSNFMENVFRYVNSNNQNYQQYRQDYYSKQYYNGMNLQYLVNEVPNSKNPPFFWMFISLGLYIILAGPVLYLILKKKDRRDWAWVIIPMLSILLLGCMYIFGFKSRYNSAVTNSVSLIKAQQGKNEATVTSAIGVFNNKRGTLKMEYEYDNGIKTPFLMNENRYYGNESEGIVVGKYTTADSILYEQYNVMMWTPTVLNAQKTIEFNGDLLKGVYFKDGSLKGSIANTTPYDLLDAVILAGRNIIPIGNVIAGDTVSLNLPLENNVNVYKGTEEYLDGEFGRTYYRTPKEYPPNHIEMMRKRNLFQNFLNYTRNTETKFILLARNEQIIDYGLKVNNKEPEEFGHNLISVESDFSFEPGSEVEIPGGIIQANMYQTGDIGWVDYENSVRIHNTGEMEFRFLLPDMLDYNEFSISVENYIPLYIKYNMKDDPNFNTEIVKNKYEYYLYNTKSRVWDQIDASVTISDGVNNYIGYGNEVLMKIIVVEVGSPDNIDRSRPTTFEPELLGMPEISVRGVAK